MLCVIAGENPENVFSYWISWHYKISIFHNWALCNRKGGNSKKNKKWVNIKFKQISAFKTILAYKVKFDFFSSFLPFYCKASICSKLKYWRKIDIENQEDPSNMENLPSVENLSITEEEVDLNSMEDVVIIESVEQQNWDIPNRNKHLKTIALNILK